MRSEAEIRSEVTARLRRRVLLLLDGGLWLAAVFVLSQIMPSRGFGSLTGLFTILMLTWTVVFGLHTMRTIYVELRERLVRGAIERERQFYLMRDHYEKQKRDEAGTYADADRLRLSDDGELIDYPDGRKVKTHYER